MHPLYDLLDTLGILVHTYEASCYPPPEVTGIDVLKFLMAEQHLIPADLPEVGNAQTITTLLAGE